MLLGITVAFAIPSLYYATCTVPLQFQGSCYVLGGCGSEFKYDCPTEDFQHIACAEGCCDTLNLSETECEADGTFSGYSGSCDCDAPPSPSTPSNPEPLSPPPAHADPTNVPPPQVTETAIQPDDEGPVDPPAPDAAAPDAAAPPVDVPAPAQSGDTVTPVAPPVRPSAPTTAPATPPSAAEPAAAPATQPAPHVDPTHTASHTHTVNHPKTGTPHAILSIASVVSAILVVGVAALLTIAVPIPRAPAPHDFAEASRPLMQGDRLGAEMAALPQYDYLRDSWNK